MKENKNKDLIVEEKELFVRVILKPDLNSDSKAFLVSGIVDKYIDRLLFVLVRTGKGRNWCATLMISKTEKYRLNQIQEELEAYFTTIRGRDISKNDGTLRG